jgi:iron complex outermembrane receptor protein
MAPHRYLTNLFFTALLSVAVVFASAQDSLQVRAADTVWIVAARQLALQPGGRQVTLDSVVLNTFAAHNLSDVLAAHTDVFVKSYGNGSLATTSLRGGGASHTALIWNGFSLQSPMNGQSDLALMPAFFLDQVSLHYGGGAALFGSGAVGGAIHLDNALTYTPGVRAAVHLHGGSFGLLQPGADVTVSDGRHTSRSRLFYREADNDFRLPTGQRQTNASLRQAGLLQEWGAKLSPRQQARVWVWAHQSERNLPPPLSADTGAAAQADRSLRLASDWSWTRAHVQVLARAAWQAERLAFTDAVSRLTSLNVSQSWVQEAELRLKPAKGPEWHLGVNHTFQWAQAGGYGNLNPQQGQAAVFASARWQSRPLRWEGVASVRQGVVAGKMIPVTPSVGFKGRLTGWLEVHGQAGRTFRNPTFNDLYWQPGGNPNLQPEKGWHQELGLRAQRTAGPIELQGHLTAFAQQINDWILWRPGRTFWYPENVRSVFSRGTEADISGKATRGRWQWLGRAGYTLTRATVSSVLLERDLSLGKQLIYTPVHQARVYVQARRGRAMLGYQHSFTGRRFTATDNSAALPAFQLGAVSGSWGFVLGKNTLQAGLRIDNLYGTRYQVMENRAMPGRNFTFSLDFFFNP